MGYLIVAVAIFVFLAWVGTNLKPKRQPKRKPSGNLPIDLKLSVKMVAETRELSPDALAFEAGLVEAIGEKIDKHFYAHVVGVTFANEDGTLRQELIAQCKEFQPVYLHTQPDHPKYPDGVYLTADIEGPMLGYLDAHTGAQISGEILCGDRVLGRPGAKGDATRSGKICRDGDLLDEI